LPFAEFRDVALESTWIEGTFSTTFGKEQDKYNTRAIADFLSELSDILSDYQVIILMAEIGIDTGSLEENYRFEQFD